MAAETQIRLEDGDHVVQFYDDDEEIVGVVGGYLSHAAVAGEAVVVIAAAAHLDVFRSAVAAVVGVAPTGGPIVMLDAADALDGFMVDGVPDPAAFEASIGGVIREAAAGGRKVRAYGEMVALLWAAGNVAAAVEVERQWNALGETIPFSLFCAYPADLMADPAAAEAFAQTCQLHSHVFAGAPIPPDAEVSRRFPRTPGASLLARRYVAGVLRDWDRDDLIDDALVVVAELAANAVRHARSDLTVGLTRHGDGVVVAVGDASYSAPLPRTPPMTTPGGRGLLLVANIACDWGHRTLPDGKVVWAALASSWSSTDEPVVA